MDFNESEILTLGYILKNEQHKLLRIKEKAAHRQDSLSGDELNCINERLKSISSVQDKLVAYYLEVESA